MSWDCTGKGNGKPFQYLWLENFSIMNGKQRRDIVGSEDGSSRSEDTQRATGEEAVAQCTAGVNDSMRSKPSNRSPVPEAFNGVAQTMHLTDKCKIGTWNVRSMNRGKLEVVMAEMDRIGLEPLGVSEMRWNSCGQVQIDNFTVLYAGHYKLRRNRVTFIMNRHASRCMLGYNAVSERLISVHLQAKPMNLTLIQVYAPTSDADEEEREEVYSPLEELLGCTPRKDAVNVMGDFNVKIGHQEVEEVCRNFRLGERNEAGD